MSQGCSSGKLLAPPVSSARNTWITPAAAPSCAWDILGFLCVSMESLHVIDMEVREFPVVSQSGMLRLSLQTCPASSSQRGCALSASTRCWCSQAGISKPPAHGDSDIRHECHPPNSSVICGSQAIEEHWELPHGCGHISSSHCPLGAALTSPALG